MCVHAVNEVKSHHPSRPAVTQRPHTSFRMRSMALVNKMKHGYVMSYYYEVYVNSHIFNQKKAARTWDMLRMWTDIDIDKLTSEKINSPANAIFMTENEHISFGNFNFIFEEVGPPVLPR
jgi:hypothetical protein